MAFLIGLTIVLYTMFGWWSDTIKEAHEGHHTRVVSLHSSLLHDHVHRLGSDVLRAWFWAFFDAACLRAKRHRSTGSPLPAASGRRKASRVLDPWHLPLYNTIILLLSGTTVTWAHHALLHNDRSGVVWGLALTVVLGLLFSFVQAYEYMVAPFSFSGSIYGATFFMATGFHGSTSSSGRSSCWSACCGRWPATSRRSSISASRRPPGTGISSTWSGSSSSCRSMCGPPVGADIYHH